VNWLVPRHGASLALLPWYTDAKAWWGASALLHGFQGRSALAARGWWLAPCRRSLPRRLLPLERERAGMAADAGGGGRRAADALQGFLFRHPNITPPSGWPTQPGMGYGARSSGIGFLMLFCHRARGARLLPRRCVRGRRDRPGGGDHRGVRVLPDLRHAGERVRGRQLPRQLP
jgi:hypothetical protein